MKEIWDEGLISGRMRGALGLWARMYAGDAPWAREDGIVSMNLPAFVAGEVARLATMEMESRVTGDGARARYLDGAYQRVIDDIRRTAELAAAYGTVALKPYIDERGEMRVDCARAGDFLPTATDADGRVTGCVFIDRARAGDKEYIRLERHTLEADGYRIENHAYAARGDELGQEAALEAVPRWAGLAPEMWLDAREPLFALLRMPYANTVEPDSPLGVSAYARAADLIREADKQFSRLLWEMESGERALYVDIRAFLPEEAEPGTLPAKRFYRTMDVDPQADTLFAEWSPGLREQSQITALNEILQRVEDACGLSRGTLSEAPESSARGARTATELKIMRQRTYASICETQREIERALRGLLRAMDAWATAMGLCERGEWEVSFAFDDSVVTDRAEAFDERMRLLEAGVIDGWEMRMWYLGETERIARRMGDFVPPTEPPYGEGSA